jgi:phage terminase large subunit-like protein
MTLRWRKQDSNLAAAFFDQITKRYQGTRLGRQELLAELLDDVPGALWSRDVIEQLRRDAAPRLRRVVVAVDPSGGEGDEHDEVGIVAAGVDEADHGWAPSCSPRSARGGLVAA